MTRGRRAVLVTGAALAVGALRFALRARVPDDYDAIGFVRALDDFNVARFQPHFPGYPVYVALGKAAHLVFHSPLDAAEAVSAIAAAVTVAGLWRAARSLANASAAATANATAARSDATPSAIVVIGLYAGASLPFVLGGAALSDSTATAFAVLAFAFLCAPRRPLAAGLSIALMLGTRASYWPLALSFAVLAARSVETRVRVLAAATLGMLAWAVPFIAVVGPRALVAAGRTHLIGHFTIWGGSIVTQSNPWQRLYTFARDLVYDGIAPNALILAASSLLIAACVRRPSPRALRLALIVCAPYAVWVLLGQNVVDQPRHLLPLVVALLFAAGLTVARRPLVSAALVALIFAAGCPLALAHARTLPAGAQAAAWVAEHFPKRDVVVIGGRSMRFFAEHFYAGPPIVARERTWTSEVYVELERLDVLPPHVLVTSEVEGPPSHHAYLTDGPTFCRDARLNRRQACLTLREYHLPGVVP